MYQVQSANSFSLMEADLFELCNHLYVFIYFPNTPDLLLTCMKLIKNGGVLDLRYMLNSAY